MKIEFHICSGRDQHKGLINLTLMDSDKWDKTAHVKSYRVGTSPKCTEYVFKLERSSSLLIKCCFENS